MNIMLIVLFIVRWFITGMSAEKINYIEVNNLPPLVTPEKSEEVLSSGRVDINVLLDRARKTQAKENSPFSPSSWCFGQILPIHRPKLAPFCCSARPQPSKEPKKPTFAALRL